MSRRTNDSILGSTDFWVSIANKYSNQNAKNIIAQNMARYSFESTLVFKDGGTVVDVGAGNGALALGCKLAGMKDVTIIEDFGDPWHNDVAKKEIMQVLEKAGVRIISANALELDWPFPNESVDCVCSFDSLEHWPHSPAYLFSEVQRVLKPGGRFVLGAPNAVNLLKRGRVLLGKTNLPPWKDFYEQIPWRGHVHEPTLSELNEIMNTLNFEITNATGRNWIALRKGYSGLTLKLIRMVIPLLNLFPTLCSDLYIVGRKPS